MMAEYNRRHADFEEFCRRLRDLIEKLVKHHKISCVFPLESRVKDRESLETKIRSADGKYSKLEDVTDIVGVRIIAYFSDDVEKIAGIVNKEFAVDSPNSVDKSKQLNPDQFGYLSQHYIVGVSDDRRNKAEWSTYANMQAEVQIRSILQHAWAEVEHDLGYKPLPPPLSKEGTPVVPPAVRRDFARLAGLLELADREFNTIRAMVGDYRSHIPAQIESHPASVALDRDSLRVFATTNPLVRELDSQLAKQTGAQLTPDDDLLARLVSYLHYLGLHTIADLRKALEKHRLAILELGSVRLAGHGAAFLSIGICLGYLAYIVAGSTLNQEEVMSYLRHFAIGGLDDATHQSLIDDIIRICTTQKC